VLFRVFVYALVGIVGIAIAFRALAHRVCSTIDAREHCKIPTRSAIGTTRKQFQMAQKLLYGQVAANWVAFVILHQRYQVA
jgi:hypothetical protein